MSDVTAEYSARLNLAETVARLERTNAETRKFVIEHEKLAAEAAKYGSERLKLDAEVAKLRHDRFYIPILAAIVGAGTLSGLITAFLPRLLHSLGFQ